MDWNNIDLKSNYERSQPIIDALSFDTLLLEVHCNIKEITEKTIRAQFEEDLQNRITSAREVLEANIKSLTAYATNERNEQE